jgi:hypothetical protein
MFRTSDFAMADILRRINSQLAHVKALREAAWGVDGPIQWAKLEARVAPCATYAAQATVQAVAGYQCDGQSVALPTPRAISR